MMSSDSTHPWDKEGGGEAGGGPGDAAAVEAHDMHAHNEKFKHLAKDELGVWVERFEGDTRELATRLPDIVHRLALSPEHTVLDVGAGTGLYTLPIAQHVQKVIAVDISAAFLDAIREKEGKARAEGQQLGSIEYVQCGDKELGVDGGVADVAVVVDTYHHFEYPQHVLRSIRAALKPRGRLFLVDFHRIPGVSSEWVLGHLRAGMEVFRAEVEEEGFVFCADHSAAANLDTNYCLEFTAPP